MISIYPFGDEFFAFTESPVVFKINPTTLRTEERIDLNASIGIINHTSHPHIDNDKTVRDLPLLSIVSVLNQELYVHFMQCFSSNQTMCQARDNFILFIGP